MSTVTDTPRRSEGPRFVELGTRRCRELVAQHDIGRVAWVAADGLQVLPVSYVWWHGTVTFRTSPYGVLSELVRPTEVVVQVDDLDPTHRTGWTVLVRGLAQAVASPAELTELWTVDGAVPWASGIRNLFITIEPHQLTGRLLVADD